MKQEFFKSTIESKFIKYLLSYTPLPIFPTISSDDTIIEGCYYIYKDKILKCTKTGRFNGINANSFIDDYLYVNEYVLTLDEDYVLSHYNSETDTFDIYLPDEGKEGGPYFGSNIPGIGGLTVTDDIVRYFYRPIGEYQLIDDFAFGQYVPNVTQRFISNTSYYDPMTHRMLGEYLRCLRDIYGLNLMGLYNCYDYDSTNKFSLTQTSVQETEALKSTVLLIPIKFDKTYTIAMDCDFPVFAKAVFSDENGLLKDSDGNSYTDLIPGQVIRYNGLRFNDPQTYKVEIDTGMEVYEDLSEQEWEEYRQSKIQTNKTLKEHEKYLYLALQIPKSNTSSIVVIEGDYSTVAYNYISSAENLENLSDAQLANVFKSNVSLLESNNGTQVPYADKLIAYLLQYTIDCREEIDDNVANVEKRIGYNPPLRDFYPGIWDTNLRYVLYSKYMQLEYPEYLDKTDIVGFVDRDIENAVDKGWIKYGV